MLVLCDQQASVSSYSRESVSLLVLVLNLKQKADALFVHCKKGEC
jgi:hypothetical protein